MERKAIDEVSPVGPAQRTSQAPQFGLRALLMFTTGLCVVFAVLSALGVAYWQTLLGFGVLAGFSLLVIIALEVGHRFAPPKPPHRPDAHQYRSYNHLGARIPTERGKPPGDTNATALADPEGIEFVEPEGIAFVAQPPLEAELLDDGDEPFSDESNSTDESAWQPPPSSDAIKEKRPDEPVSNPES